VCCAVAAGLSNTTRHSKIARTKFIGKLQVRP
jgi:hypothetical protein